MLGPGLTLPFWFLKNFLIFRPIKGRLLIGSLVSYGLIALAWVVVGAVYILYPGGHPPIAPLAALAAAALSFFLAILALILCVAHWVVGKKFLWLYLDILITNFAIFMVILLIYLKYK